MLRIVLKQSDVKTRFYNVVSPINAVRKRRSQRESPFVILNSNSDLGQRKHRIKEPLYVRLAKRLMQINIVVTSELMGHAMTGISKSFLAVRMKSSRLQKVL